MARVIVTVIVLFILIIFCSLGFAFMFPERTVNTPLYKISQFLDQFRVKNNDWNKHTVNQYNFSFEYPKSWEVKETRFADCEEYDTSNGNQPCTFVTISNDKAEIIIKVSTEIENGKMYPWGDATQSNKIGVVNVDGRDLDITELKEAGKRKFVIYGEKHTFNIKKLNLLMRLQQKSNSSEEFYANELDSESVDQARKIIDSIQIN